MGTTSSDSFANISSDGNINSTDTLQYIVDNTSLNIKKQLNAYTITNGHTTINLDKASNKNIGDLIILFFYFVQLIKNIPGENIGINFNVFIGNAEYSLTQNNIDIVYNILQSASSANPLNVKYVGNNSEGNFSITMESIISSPITIVYNTDTIIVSNINIFIPIIDIRCFLKGTKISTPSGNVNIEDLKDNDIILTSTNKSIIIKKMVAFTTNSEMCKLYCLEKGMLEDNLPTDDLYMSAGHAFKHDDKWKHMIHSNLTKRMGDMDNIEYYHIIIDNYFENNIIANGVEVEACYDEHIEQYDLKWKCTPSLCVRQKKSK